ncbi:autophagy-related protein 27 [Trametes maxima]|nr:autophagy-related protein 27 [Trametes maxima]
MVVLRHHVSRLALLTLVSAFASAQDEPKPFECNLTIGDRKYDLNTIDGEHTVSRSLSVPPTTIEDKVTFNLCKDLERKSDVPSEDQCPTGTRACLVRTNHKEGQSDRVFSVIPLANSSAEASTVNQLSSPKGLDLTFAGPSYPSAVNADPIPQFFHLKLLCSTETSNINFTSYDGKDLHLEWSAPAGCGFGGPPEGGEKPGDAPNEGGDGESGGKKESEGSGLGYFFLILLLAFVAYFGLGAYYNYSTYGATGADLIPHRDFWREVPYMLKDVVSHLCSAVRPRQASRGGYIAV